MARTETVFAITVLLLMAGHVLLATGYAYTARIGLLAVTDHSGEVIPADISISRGNGGLVVEPVKYVHPSVLYSSRIGYILASLVSHIPPSNVYVKIMIHTDTEVQGPSASGFIASTILLGLRGVYPSNDTTMTGMISLTGFILPVAGIKYKVEAATKAGYHRIILPYGEEAPNTTLASTNTTILNACSLEQASSYIASAPINLGNYTLPGHSVKTLHPLNKYIDEGAFTNYTIYFVKALRALLAEYRGADKAVYQSLLGLAEDALENNHSYSAASIAFYALVSVASKIEEAEGFQAVEKALNTSLRQEIAKAREALRQASRDILNESICDAWRVEALAAASSRLYLAEHAASNPGASKTLALLRAISARSWIQLARSIHGPRVSCVSLRTAIEGYVDYASLSYKYMMSVLPFLARQLLMPDNRSVSSWLSDARKALERGDYVLALGLAENTIASFEDVLVNYASLPLSCVASHVYFLLGNSAIGYALPALLYIGYATSYAEKVGNIVGEKTLPSILGSDAATWALFGLFGWLVKGIEGKSIETITETYSQPASIEPLIAESVVLGAIVYAVASLSRRASLEEI